MKPVKQNLLDQTQNFLNISCKTKFKSGLILKFSPLIANEIEVILSFCESDKV